MFSTTQAAALIGVPHSRLIWAYRRKQLPEPLRVGQNRALTPEDLERARQLLCKPEQAGPERLPFVV